MKEKTRQIILVLIAIPTLTLIFLVGATTIQFLRQNPSSNTKSSQKKQIAVSSQPKGKKIAAKTKPEDKLVVDGLILVSKGDYGEAIKVFDKALKINPKNAAAWMWQAECYGALVQTTDAIYGFNEAIYLNPQYGQAWEGKGRCFASIYSWGQALPCFEKAIELGLENERVWYGKGVSLYYTDNHASALQCFNHVLEINVKHTMAWVGKFYATKDRGEKTAVFEKIRALDPTITARMKYKVIPLY